MSIHWTYMTSNLDILDNLVSRKIYNLCFREGLSKKEISENLYGKGKWLPNAILPKIEELERVGYLKLVEEGKNYQRKRGKYFATMLPVLEFMKTRSPWVEEEKEFLESEYLKREFLRINKDLKLEDDWLRPFRTFLEDLLLFRLVSAPQVDEKFLTTFVDICKQVIADSDRKLSKDIESHRLLQKDVEDSTILHNSAQSHTKVYNSVQNGTKMNDNDQNQSKVIKSYQYDRIVEKSIEFFGNQYEIPENSSKHKETLESSNKHQNSLENVKNGESINTNNHQQTSRYPMTSYLKTDYLCLSLLMPERLCSRIKFSSPKGEMFSYLEGMQRI